MWSEYFVKLGLDEQIRQSFNQLIIKCKKPIGWVVRWVKGAEAGVRKRWERQLPNVGDYSGQRDHDDPQRVGHVGVTPKEF